MEPTTLIRHWQLSSYLIDKPDSEKRGYIHSYLSEFDSADGLVVVSDQSLRIYMNGIGSSSFLFFFDTTRCGNNIQNVLSHTLSKVFRAFQAYSQRFDDEKYQRLLILPLRNFRSPEITRLQAMFADGIDPALGNDLDRYLGDMRERQKPKRRDSRADVFVVDSNQNYFKYGHERHSKAETASPPHNSLCFMNSIYRFGRRVDSERHFNVSRDGTVISGHFDNCHDQEETVGAKSHLNMFTNDYFGI